MNNNNYCSPQSNRKDIIMIFQNEKGVTLVEILLAITILLIILTSIMNFFPQMAQMNKQNTNKSQAVQLAREVLVEWQEYSQKNNNDLVELLQSGSEAIDEIEGLKKIDYDDSYFIFEGKRDSFNVKVTIEKDSDLESKPHQLHYTQIQIYNDRNEIVSETYGYIEYRSSLGGGL